MYSKLDELIKNGDHNGLLVKLEGLDLNNLDSSFFLKVLLSLDNILMKLEESDKAKLNKQEIFDVANTCCTALFDHKKGEHYKCLTLIHPIHQYLLKYEPPLAKKLSSFVFKLDPLYHASNVVFLFITDYATFIADLSAEELLSQGNEGLLFCIPLLLKLVDLYGYKEITICLVIRCLAKLLKNTSGERQFHPIFASYTYKILTKFFSLIKSPMNLSEDAYDDFFHYLADSIIYRDDSASPTSISSIEKCVDFFQQIAVGDNKSFDLMKIFLQLLSTQRPLMKPSKKLKQLLGQKFAGKSKILVSAISLLHKRLWHSSWEDINPAGACDLLKCLFSSYFNHGCDDRMTNVVLTSLGKFTLFYHKKKLDLECGDLSMIFLNYVVNNVVSDESILKLILRCVQYIVTSSDVVSQFGAKVQLIILALATIYEDIRFEIFNFWAKVKSMECFNNYKEFTVVHFVQKYGKIMEKAYSVFKVANVDLDYFLFLEIKSFTSVHNVPKETVLSVLATVLKMENRTYHTIALVLCADIITSRFSHADTKELRALLMQCIDLNVKLLLRNNSCELNLLLGSLYCQLFRCELANLQRKNEEELNKSEVKEKNAKVPHADQDLEIDHLLFVPNYTYGKHKKLMNLLDLAREHYELAFKMFKCIDFAIVETIFRQMETLAYIFRLYKSWEGEKSIWHLISKFGQKTQSFEFRVIGLAQLLPLSLEKKFDIYNKIKDKLCTNKTSISPAARNCFLLNLAKFAYHNNKVEDSKEILKSFNPKVENYNFWVALEYEMFSAMVENTSPKTVVVAIQKCYDSLLLIIEGKKYYSFAEFCCYNSALMDCAILLARLSKKIESSRDAKKYLKYLKHQFLTAVRLTIPFRVCEFLTELAYVDMAAWNGIECDKKLKAIGIILNYDDIRSHIKRMILLPPLENITFEKLIPEGDFTDSFGFLSFNLHYQILALSITTLTLTRTRSNRFDQDIDDLEKTGSQLADNIISHSSSRMMFYDYIARFYCAIVTNSIAQKDYRNALLFNLRTLNIIDCTETNIFIDRILPLYLRNLTNWVKKNNKKPTKKANGEVKTKNQD